MTRDNAAAAAAAVGRAEGRSAHCDGVPAQLAEDRAAAHEASELAVAKLMRDAVRFPPAC